MLVSTWFSVRASFLRLRPVVLTTLLMAVIIEPTYAGFAISGTLGAQAKPQFKDFGFGYNVTVYGKFDDQTLFGVQSGQGIVGDSKAIPILGVGYLRLPIGRVVMPVLTGGAGYAISDSLSGFTWRAGGLFDIRNGRYSSLLLGAEYEGRRGHGGMVARAGLLLEF